MVLHPIYPEIKLKRSIYIKAFGVGCPHSPEGSGRSVNSDLVRPSPLTDKQSVVGDQRCQHGQYGQRGEKVGKSRHGLAHLTAPRIALHHGLLLRILHGVLRVV